MYFFFFLITQKNAGKLAFHFFYVHIPTVFEGTFFRLGWKWFLDEGQITRLSAEVKHYLHFSYNLISKLSSGGNAEEIKLFLNFLNLFIKTFMQILIRWEKGQGCVTWLFVKTWFIVWKKNVCPLYLPEKKKLSLPSFNFYLFLCEEHLPFSSNYLLFISISFQLFLFYLFLPLHKNFCYHCYPHFSLWFQPFPERGWQGDEWFAPCSPLLYSIYYSTQTNNHL